MTPYELKNEILDNNPGWEVCFEKINNQEMHLVFSHSYNIDINKYFHVSNNTTVQCWVGFHQKRFPNNSKVIVSVDSVLFSKDDINSNSSGLKIFRNRFVHPKNFELSYPYSIDSDTYFLLKGKKNKSYKSFLNKLYNKHINQIRVFPGFFIRLFHRTEFYLLANIFAVLCHTFRLMIYLINGRKYKNKTIDILVDNFLKKEQKTNKLEIDEEQKVIEILSIKVNAFSAFTYSVLHLLLAFLYIFLNIHNVYISKIMNSTLLNITYVIVTLTIWESVLPCVFDKLILFTANQCNEIKNRT